TALEHLGPRDQAWVIEAAERPRLVAAYRGPRPDPDAPTAPLTGTTGEATDLQAALEAARSLLSGAPGLSGSPPGRIVLVSDGRETTGDALASLRAGAAFPPVDVVPVLAGPDPEVAVGDVFAPPAVAPGDPVPLEVRVYASRPQTARLSVVRDGRLLWAEPVRLRTGWQSLGFEDPSPSDAPAVVYEARLDPAADDTEMANNRAAAAVAVQGVRRVLYVGEGASTGAAWLSSAGLPAQAAAPGALPASRAGLARYSAVVLDDVPASALTAPQMEALADAVVDMGLGLVVLGGPHSFGPGGYLDAPLERVLPVRSEVPARLIVPQVALVLVIDKSGSMGERSAAGTKLDAARRAAAAALELLSPGDLVGVLAFDGQPRWVQHLQPASERQALLHRMAALTADGGTDLGPALQEALASLEPVRAMVRHVIVLSDGRSNPADFEGMTRAAASRGITVSTVAIGPDADAVLLADIARWGRGRFYQTRDLRAIPQIFASETITVARSALVPGPAAVSATGAPGAGESLLPPGLPALPALGGYVATTPRPGATVYAASSQGDPILAAWRAGLGRVVAFTSSLTGPWGESWQAEGLAPEMLRRMVRWVLPAAGVAGGTSRLYLELQGDRGQVVLEALDPQGRPLNFLDVEASVSGPGGISLALPLRQEAPGRYAAGFDASGPGEYAATVAFAGQRLQAVAVRAYPAELEPGPPSPTLLATLAHESGGQVLGYILPGGPDDGRPELAPALAEAAARLASLPPGRAGARQGRPAWPWLVGLALGLLVADVAVRRVESSPRELLASLRGEWIEPLRQRLRRQHPRRAPTPQEVVQARRRAAASPSPGDAPPAGAGGVDPARAARLYLARLQRERRAR
ncbi:MAG TPA: VWA domain-containing protein, partial [Limnochordales bacterium]